MKKNNFNNNIKAFTLVELAVVITIIGFVVGGIFVAKDLIEISKLNRTYIDAKSFKTAIYLFKEDYGGFPGDLTNASDIWPNCDPTPTDCNGDGDGEIYDPGGNEMAFAWEQLSTEGYIKGTYDAVGAWQPGYNIPKGPFDGTGYKIQTNSGVTEIELNGMNPSSGWDPAVTPLQAYIVDRKFDDGVPEDGAIWGTDGNGVSDCTSSGEYNTSENTLQCRLKFIFSE